MTWSDCCFANNNNFLSIIMCIGDCMWHNVMLCYAQWSILGWIICYHLISPIIIVKLKKNSIKWFPTTSRFRSSMVSKAIKVKYCFKHLFPVFSFCFSLRHNFVFTRLGSPTCEALLRLGKWCRNHAGSPTVTFQPVCIFLSYNPGVINQMSALLCCVHSGIFTLINLFDRKVMWLHSFVELTFHLLKC